ncbi:MAG TPA: glycosyltransferase family 1 protein, partial [Armatimonadetes bacterium]|nr:glycosyltransferase family 1 protein [Armatimonadota bacterium]
IRRLFNRRVACIIANSEYTARHFALEGKMPAKMRVVYNGVDLRRFDPERVEGQRVREEWGVPPEVPLLGMVGQITPWKGQLEAIKALALVRQRFPEARLAIVGTVKFATGVARYDNVAYAQRLVDAAEERGVEVTGRLGDWMTGGARGTQPFRHPTTSAPPAVLFAGEREDIPEVMAALDVLVLPSWEEPFGRVVIEAMAMRKPVVATAVGGPGEIVVDGSGELGKGATGNRKSKIENRASDFQSPTSIPAEPTGLLVPPRQPKALAEAVCWLLEHPKEARAMGEAGRRRVEEQFTVERVVEGVREVWGEVVAE